MINKIIASLNITLILCSVDALATIYDYAAIGQFEVGNTTQYVSGNVQISDEFLYSQGAGFHFNITGFDFSVFGGGSSYDFSGNSGALANMPMVKDPQTGEWLLYERQWWFSDPVDVWSNSFDTGTPTWSSCWNFFSSEMIPYSPTSSEYYGILASYIALSGPKYATQYTTEYGHHIDGVGQILLTRDSQPVPEPSTILLLVTGLLAPFLTRLSQFRPKFGNFRAEIQHNSL